MSTFANNGSVIGRLANDPRVFVNQDGSRKVSFTVFTKLGFTRRNGESETQVSLETLVPANVNFAKSPFSMIHKGDKIGIAYHLETQKYLPKGAQAGEEVYVLKAIADDIEFLESRSATQGRLAQRVAQNEQANAAAENAAAAAPVQAQAPVQAAQAPASSMLDEPFATV